MNRRPLTQEVIKPSRLALPSTACHGDDRHPIQQFRQTRL